MFGAYYYGFVDRENVKGDLKVVELAKMIDPRDFMFSNSPYPLVHERPISRSLVLIHFDPLATGDTTMTK